MEDRELDPIPAAMLNLVVHGESRITRVTPNGNAAQQVVRADTRRLLLRVYGLLNGATVGVLLPDPDLVIAWATTTINGPMEVKFHDAPTLTTGAWYGKGTDASGWMVIEEIYMGD